MLCIFPVFVHAHPQHHLIGWDATGVEANQCDRKGKKNPRLCTKRSSWQPAYYQLLKKLFSILLNTHWVSNNKNNIYNNYNELAVWLLDVLALAISNAVINPSPFKNIDFSWFFCSSRNRSTGENQHNNHNNNNILNVMLHYLYWLTCVHVPIACVIFQFTQCAWVCASTGLLLFGSDLLVLKLRGRLILPTVYWLWWLYTALYYKWERKCAS